MCMVMLQSETLPRLRGILGYRYKQKASGMFPCKVILLTKVAFQMVFTDL